MGVGRVTRLLRFLADLPKTYTGEVVLGTATTTLDASGDVVASFDMSAVTVEHARRSAEGLTGSIMQIPPMVSAVSVGGKRLHALARAGVEVERAPRAVTVHRFDIDAALQPGVLAIEVECSSGTYVRSLAADLGAALGGGAHLRALRRTAVGGFGVSQAVALDALRPEDLLPPRAAVRHLPGLVVNRELVSSVRYGKPIAASVLGLTEPGPWALHDETGSLLAVYADAPDGMAKPDVVIDPA